MLIRLAAAAIGLLALFKVSRRCPNLAKPGTPPRLSRFGGGMTVLLGAGFSQGLGIAGTAKIGCEIDAALAASAYACEYIPLRDRLARRFEADYNFEVFLAALEACVVYAHPGLLPGGPEYQSVIPEIASLRTDLTAAGASQMYEIAMDIITREIGKDWRTSIEETQEAAFKSFFDRLRSRWILRVATLNYDNSIESFVPDFVDGFVDHGTRQEFDSQVFLADDDRPRLAHLHGSLAFGITEGDTEFVKIVGPGGPRRERIWTELLNGMFWTAVVTGADKPNKLVLRPYSVYYAWLANAMLDSPRMILVGYGMADLHINAWLTNAILHHNRDYRLVIIDSFTGDALPKRLEGMFAMAAGVRHEIEVTAALGTLKFTDDIAVRGTAMVIRSGLPLSQIQGTKMLAFLN